MARVEREVLLPIKQGETIINDDKSMTQWLQNKIAEKYSVDGTSVCEMRVQSVEIEEQSSATTKLTQFFIRAKVSFVLVSGKTRVISQPDVEALIPILVSELVILAHLILKGSIFEPLAPVVGEMISVFVPKHAVAFYCGADSGKRPGKIIVLSIFKAIEEFFGEMETAMKQKSKSEDILAAMQSSRVKSVDSSVIITRLLEWANIPLSSATASSAVAMWFCDPEKMARAFDRVLQFPKRNVEPTTVEPTDESGGANFGEIDVETRWDEFGSAIGAAIHSVLKAGSIAAPVRFLEQIVLFLGAQKKIGRALDESLDPTIDIHIMNCNLLQKLFSGPQTSQMPEGVASVAFFYSEVLGKLIEENVPRPFQSYAKKTVETVASVVSRTDMLKDLVFNFVLPHLLAALEQL